MSQYYPNKATRKHTKQHNQRLILKTIYDQGQISRAEIARLTNLTPATVSSLVAELLKNGLVAESHGQKPKKRGKPAKSLSIINTSRQIIGVDLSRNTIQGAIVDLRGNVSHRENIPVDQITEQNAQNIVYELISTLVSKTTNPLLGIGVGLPGLVDREIGVVCSAVDPNWQDLPLRDLLQQRYHVPVYIANDSHAAALGEYLFGQKREIPNMIVVRVGPGVSAGIILNGQLHQGNQCGAGEIGHVKIVIDGELCPCGHTGCLETVVSKRVLLKKSKELAKNNPQSKLHQFVSTPEDVQSIEHVVQAYIAGDEEIHQVVDVMGHYLGISIASLVGALNIQHILIAGSMSCFGNALLDPIRQSLKQSALAELANHTQVNLSQLGADIVIQGAAALLLSYELGLN